MKPIKALALALVAMFALGVVAASSASAVQAGPLYLLTVWDCVAASPGLYQTQNGCYFGTGVDGAWTNGFTPVAELQSRLLSGQTVNVTTKNLGNFTLTAPGAATTVCTGLSAPTTLLGGSPGLSDTEILFSGCEAAGGTACDALNQGGTPGTIAVNTKDELVYVGEKEEAVNEAGHLGDLFTPAAGGTTFVTLVYLALSGGSCPGTAVTTTVTGSVVGLVEPANTMNTQGMLTFPAKPITKVWQWLGLGKVHEVSSSLKAFGIAVAQLGLADLELENGNPWGVLTQ